MPQAPDRLVLIGRVSGAFGVTGEVRITTYTAQPEALLSYRSLFREDGKIAMTLTQGRVAKGALIARAQEITTRDQAEAVKGLELFLPRSRFSEPEEDEFYLTDLIGLTAITPDGARLGRVKAVHNFGAGDILEVEADTPGDGFMAPFSKAAVPEIDLDNGKIVIVRPAEI